MFILSDISTSRTRNNTHILSFWTVYVILTLLNDKYATHITKVLQIQTFTHFIKHILKLLERVNDLKNKETSCKINILIGLLNIFILSMR